MTVSITKIIWRFLGIKWSNLIYIIQNRPNPIFFCLVWLSGCVPSVLLSFVQNFVDVTKISLDFVLINAKRFNSHKICCCCCRWLCAIRGAHVAAVTKFFLYLIGFWSYFWEEFSQVGEFVLLSHHSTIAVVVVAVGFDAHWISRIIRTLGGHKDLEF